MYSPRVLVAGFALLMGGRLLGQCTPSGQAAARLDKPAGGS
jgi:hypothetical protein